VARVSKKLATADPAAQSHGWQLVTDRLNALFVKWHKGPVYIGTPQVIKDGTSFRVQDGFILPVDVELTFEGTGEVILEGDAEIRLYSNWTI
jgi:acyl-coenzyme A thioesterase PaaI-like protein